MWWIFACSHEWSKGSLFYHIQVWMLPIGQLLSGKIFLASHLHFKHLRIIMWCYVCLYLITAQQSPHNISCILLYSGGPDFSCHWSMWNGAHCIINCALATEDNPKEELHWLREGQHSPVRWQLGRYNIRKHYSTVNIRSLPTLFAMLNGWFSSVN